VRGGADLNQAMALRRVAVGRHRVGTDLLAQAITGRIVRERLDQRQGEDLECAGSDAYGAKTECPNLWQLFDQKRQRPAQAGR
jgi:hypothetical protein